MIQISEPTQQQLDAIAAKHAQFTPLPAGFDFSDSAAWADYLTTNYAHLTCKACYAVTSEDTWWLGSGDVYCFGCCVQMETELGDVTFSRIDTPEQRADREYWAAQDIGTN